MACCISLKNNENKKPRKAYKNYKKGAWFNDPKLRKEYESVNVDIIPSLLLTDFNDDEFLKQYRYGKAPNSTHWLIPNVLLVGEDPSYFAETLLADGFTQFVSLHEWKHQDYEHVVKKYKKKRGGIDAFELRAFTIDDFGTNDDASTLSFIANLMDKILTINPRMMNVSNNESGGHHQEDDDKLDIGDIDDIDDKLGGHHQENDDILDIDDIDDTLFGHDQEDEDGNDDDAKEKEKENEKEQDEHSVYVGKMYLHCLGGHGRTGLISGLLLQAMYGMDTETAQKFVNYVHTTSRVDMGDGAECLKLKDNDSKWRDCSRNRMQSTRDTW